MSDLGTMPWPSPKCRHCGNPHIRATSMTTGCCDGERRDFHQTKSKSPMSKLHTLTLNQGAIHVLAQVLGAPGFLTEAADIYRAGEILEEQLLDLPTPDEIPKGTDQIAAEKLVRAWQRLPCATPVILSERQRDTAKKAVQACIGKGSLPPGPASLCLLRELGLAPEA